MKLWLIDLGRSLEQAGISLTVVLGRDAYAEGKEGNLSERRTAMAEYGGCKADVRCRWPRLSAWSPLSW